MPDTVPAMLEPGEFVIRRDAAEKIGMDNLEMLNNADRLESGHSAIDELIALSTLSGSQQMMMGGDVEKMPQSGYMADGGSVDDPLEIDARSRMTVQQAGNIGGIGVRDYDSPEAIMRSLQQIQGDKELKDMLMRRAGSEENYRAHVKNREDSGSMMTQDEIIDILSRAAGKTQNMFKPDNIKGYVDGGSTYTYGSGQTEVPNIADIYEAAGIMPDSPQQLEDFQSKFLYDPSREETTVADYTSNVSGIRSSASGALESARAKSESIGGGFSGFGERGRMVSEAGEAVGEKAGRALEDSQRGLFEDIRQQREDYISDGVAGLDRLGEAGTTGYTPEESTMYSGSRTTAGDYIEYYGNEGTPPDYNGVPQGGEYYTDANGIEYAFFQGKWHKKQ